MRVCVGKQMAEQLSSGAVRSEGVGKPPFLLLSRQGKPEILKCERAKGDTETDTERKKGSLLTATSEPDAAQRKIQN